MIKQYNYSHLISEKDQKKAIKLVDKLIKSGEWNNNSFSPTFQTWTNLYKYEEFSVFYETFIKSSIDYLNNVDDLDSYFDYSNNVSHDNIMMWVYRDNRFNNRKKDQSRLWHEHSMGTYKISGLYYLRNPRNEATEFVDFDLKPEPYTWYIYPASLLHKPPVIKSFRNRYTIGADFKYC